MMPHSKVASGKAASTSCTMGRRFAVSEGSERVFADAADADYRYVDADGNEYRYVVDETGGAIVVACEAVQECVEVPAHMGGRAVSAIGADSFSSSGGGFSFARRVALRNSALRRVVLPEGVQAIGRGAFRGCAGLIEVVLPSTLRRIDDYAFSCSGVRAIYLPGTCTQLSPLALRLGPESVQQAELPFSSKLQSVYVSPGNACFVMHGPVLCRVDDGGDGLEALLCPARVEEVDLAVCVNRIAEGAFAGSAHIGHVRVREGLQLASLNGLIANATCNRVTIAFMSGGGADADVADAPPAFRESGCPAAVIDVAMPAGAACHRILDCTKGMPVFDARQFMARYDDVLLGLSDKLAQAKLILARLAQPIFLDEALRQQFERIVQANMDAICVHFGARGYWEGYECMASAGLLTETALERAVDVLTRRADGAAVSYLLKLKQVRGQEAAWDYDL